MNKPTENELKGNTPSAGSASEMSNEQLSCAIDSLADYLSPTLSTDVLTCREAARRLRLTPDRPKGGEEITGETSDGYHTFNELYDHRCTLFLALLKASGQGWISGTHDDGSQWDGWFIAGMGTVAGPVTYHLPVKMWSLACEAGIRVLDRAPPWDGHTSKDVVERIQKHLLKTTAPEPSAPDSKGDEDFDTALGETIDQRDAAEDCIEKLLALLGMHNGHHYEWSNLFGFSEAVELAEDALHETVQEAVQAAMKSAPSAPDSQLANLRAQLDTANARRDEVLKHSAEFERINLRLSGEINLSKIQLDAQKTALESLINEREDLLTQLGELKDQIDAATDLLKAAEARAEAAEQRAGHLSQQLSVKSDLLTAVEQRGEVLPDCSEALDMVIAQLKHTDKMRDMGVMFQPALNAEVLARAEQVLAVSRAALSARTAGK